MPGGRVTREAFDTLCDEIVAGIRAALPVDGVLLVLHGAMALENDDDGEGPLLIRAVRDVVGPSIPIVAPLDLHTNLSDEMVAGVERLRRLQGVPAHRHARDRRQATADPRRLDSTGDAAGDGPHEAAADRAQPVDGDDLAVAAEDRDRPRARDGAEPGVLAATVLGGFPFADVPFAGVATIVVTEEDPALARRYADELAAICWERRDDFTIQPTPVADAIAEAMAGAAGSVYVLADIADSGASGTAGDGTAILRGLLEANARSAAVAQIMDREAVAACIDGRRRQRPSRSASAASTTGCMASRSR